MHARALPFEVVHFRPPSTAVAMVETLSLADLRSRASAEHLARPQRLEFMLLVLYTRGRGEHVVDFVTHPVGARTLVIVPPGSVHQFRLHAGLQARILIAEPAAMQPIREMRELHDMMLWPHCLHLRAGDAAEFSAICGALAADTRRPASAALLQALALQRLQTCLLLLQMSWQGRALGAAGASSAHSITHEFRRLIEGHFHERWPAARYAARLGYAEKTLARACVAANGLTPKAWIDARVLLEAKRALAHRDDSVQAIALELGFEASSQLVRFFRRLHGDTPMAFRRSIRPREG